MRATVAEAGEKLQEAECYDQVLQLSQRVVRYEPSCRACQEVASQLTLAGRLTTLPTPPAPPPRSAASARASRWRRWWRARWPACCTPTGRASSSSTPTGARCTACPRRGRPCPCPRRTPTRHARSQPRWPPSPWARAWWATLPRRARPSACPPAPAPRPSSRTGGSQRRIFKYAIKCVVLTHACASVCLEQDSGSGPQQRPRHPREPRRGRVPHRERAVCADPQASGGRGRGGPRHRRPHASGEPRIRPF